MQLSPRSDRQSDQSEIDEIRAEHEAQSQRVVQRRASSASADVDLAYGQVATRGVAGPAEQLPHLDTIQRAFGAYDVSGILAHQGAEAAQATAAMDARAYATGDHVAFGTTPDLHTAAHEAAHVVQQRAGVHLAGGVGRSGDAYEQHADRVADAVVAGEPAEYLLAQMAPASARAPASNAVQMKELPKGNEAFSEMWAAHPHNYLPDSSQNTSSEEVLETHGLPESYANTCAIRLSIMLNKTGLTITPESAAAAGLGRRPHYSRKTKQYYIIAAAEMWQYLTKHFRAADIEFPKQGRFRNEREYDKAYETQIKPLVEGKKGIVAFDKIFSYGGSGHVDIFDGETLSDGSWYASQRVLLWYVAV